MAYTMNTEAKKEKPSHLSLLAILFCIIVLSVGLFYLSNRSKNNRLASSSAPVENSIDAASPVDQVGESLPGSTESSSEITNSELGLKMQIKDYRFNVSGTVDSFSSLQAITLAVNDTYGQYGTANIKINPGGERSGWIRSAPALAKNFAALDEGEVVIGKDSVVLTGKAPNDASYEKLNDLLSSDPFPSLRNDVAVNSSTSSTLKVLSENESYVITGEMPSQSLVDQITASTDQLFGNSATTVNIDVNDATFARLANIRFNEIMIGLIPFGDFEAGIGNGGVYVVLQDGLEVQNNEFTEDSKTKIARLTFTAELTDHPIQIVASGGENSEEAAERAQLFADVLVDSGIDSERLVVRGQTQTSRSASFLSDRDYSYEMVIEP